MEKNNQVYVKLQKHLDNQVLGYPATRSGVEIKILQHFFTPREAEIACCLNYKLFVDSIRTGHMDLLK